MTFRSLLVSVSLFAPALLGGCAGGAAPPVTDGGPGQSSTKPDENVRITVSGSATLFPPARAWLLQHGVDVPSLEGLRLRVEEPLYGVLSDVRASFGEATLGAEGTFRVGEVPVKDLALGLAAGVDDPAVAGSGVARVAPTSTMLYDTTREGRRPRVDVRDAQAWVLPRAYVDALSQALGSATISTIAPGKQHLSETGFVLGRVVDEAGAPVAGVRVVVSPADLAPHIFYPSADHSAAGPGGTSSSGLFVLVHDGGDMRTFTLTVDGHPEFPHHSGSAARGAGLVMPVFPDQP
jgi:hypothetical protein